MDVPADVIEALCAAGAIAFGGTGVWELVQDRKDKRKEAVHPEFTCRSNRHVKIIP
jgi:hypothetical protein